MPSLVATRIVRRFLASHIKVIVDVPETLDARRKFPAHPEAVIASFASPITLYRIFDGEEMVRILSTGKITGGTYSVKAERSHGASWGSDMESVIRWGNNLRGKRLGDDLFLARLHASGKKFFHLDPEIRDIDPNGPSTQTMGMDANRINLSLGASVMDVSLGDVDLSLVHPDGRVEPLSANDAKSYVNKRVTKDVDLRKVHDKFYQGSIFGVDVRIYAEGDFWKVFLNDDRQIVSGAKTKDDAIELAQMSIKIRPDKPVPMDGSILEQKRRYEKHFDVGDDPNKVRGNYALKPKDRVTVIKGSSKIGIKTYSKLIVADVYQVKGERAVTVKVLDGSRPIVLYATHPNRLGDKEIALLDSRGSRILVTKS